MIRALADDLRKGSLHGAYEAAAQRFVDYWNGAGAWHDLRAEVKMALLRWLPKAPLDFAALIEEPTPRIRLQSTELPDAVAAWRARVAAQPSHRSTAGPFGSPRAYRSCPRGRAHGTDESCSGGCRADCQPYPPGSDVRAPRQVYWRSRLRRLNPCHCTFPRGCFRRSHRGNS